MCVCEMGVFVSERGRRRRGMWGGHSVLFLIEQQLPSFSAETERGRGRAAWREAVRALDV